MTKREFEIERTIGQAELDFQQVLKHLQEYKFAEARSAAEVGIRMLRLGKEFIGNEG